MLKTCGYDGCMQNLFLLLLFLLYIYILETQFLHNKMECINQYFVGMSNKGIKGFMVRVRNGSL